MSNSSVTAKVVDEHGQGIGGLVVGAFDIGVFGEALLADTQTPNDPAAQKAFPGHVWTRPDGSFTIVYRAGKHDLAVRVYDTVGRLVGVEGPQNDVSATSFEWPDSIVVPRDEAFGYVATGGEFSRVIDGNFVEVLIDNHDAWAKILDEVGRARTTIHWMLFYLDIGQERMTFSPDIPDPGGILSGRNLEDALTAAAKSGVKVRLACNQLTFEDPVDAIEYALPWPTNTAEEVVRRFTGVANVEVRPLPTPASGPIHTKFVVIDNNRAFVIGSPFVSDYYDASSHLIRDARHGTFRTSFPSAYDSRGIRVPVHDVSLLVRGPALGPLNETFRLHWNNAKASGPALPAAPIPPSEPAAASVQVVRTLAGNGRYPSVPHGETAILEAYLRAINQATTYIYLENQYFTCTELADALIRRVKQAKQLQLIFLTNNKVDIPGYSSWQPATIQHVLDGLTQDERRRVGFFTTWSHEPDPTQSGKTRICRSYIHSKVGIIDDKWATVGSANLDGDSLKTGDNASRGVYSVLASVFTLRSGPVVEENRESETNVVVLDGIAGGRSTGLAAGLRKSLWAEHLGYPSADAAELVTAPAAGGWLGLWNDAAAKKLAGLKASPITTDRARVLRYPYDDAAPKVHANAEKPDKYLTYAGVDPKKLTVRDTFERFDWSTGKWLPDG